MTSVVANPPTGVATAAGTQAMPNYPMASLYVGDLHPEVTEAILFEKFSAAGPVLSIRVCRDAITRRSLGYAYVNFQQPADAERSLDTMNFDQILGKPIRIMWSQRDPSLRRSGVGNIFIKHLDKYIDNKAIHDTFSTFGTILSCKVVLDEKGQSRGYGFVHFESEKSAKSAIEKVNGMLLNDKKVYVGMFEPRSAREKKLGESRKFQNVFIKNFKDSMTEEQLKQMFSKFGQIESIYIARFDDPERQGRAKGFGFVSFKSPDSAEKAVSEMNGSTEMANEMSNEGKLYVGRAQKKNERAAELKRQYEEKKTERMQKFQGVNLYVKNLVDDIDDEELERMFQKYGKITSAKVMRDESNSRSRGFGFVCFEEAEDATRAVTEMNTKVVKDKPLYVALAQRKEERKSQLAAQYMQRLAQMRMHSTMPGQMYTPGVGGHFVAQGQPFGAGQLRPGAYMPQQMGQLSAMGQRGMPQASWQQTRMQAMPQAAYGGVGGMNQQYPIRGQQMGVAGQQMGVSRPIAPTQLMGQRTMGPQSQQPVRQHTAMQQRGMQPSGVRPSIAMGGNQYKTAQVYGNRGEDIGLAQLSSMAPQEQKQFIGEQLYPLVSSLTGQDEAGKVTGMLLEMENAELLAMIEDRKVLQLKVNDAMDALLTNR